MKLGITNFGAGRKQKRKNKRVTEFLCYICKNNIGL